MSVCLHKVIVPRARRFQKLYLPFAVGIGGWRDHDSFLAVGYLAQSEERATNRENRDVSCIECVVGCLRLVLLLAWAAALPLYGADNAQQVKVPGLIPDSKHKIRGEKQAVSGTNLKRAQPEAYDSGASCSFSKS